MALVRRQAARHGKEQILCHGHVRKQQRILKNQAHATQVGRQQRQVSVVQTDTASKKQGIQTFGHAGQRARDGRQHRAFAATAGPHEREDLACGHMLVQALNHSLRRCAQAVDVDLQSRFHVFSLIAPIFSNWRGRPSQPAKAKANTGKSICKAA